MNTLRSLSVWGPSALMEIFDEVLPCDWNSALQFNRTYSQTSGGVKQRVSLGFSLPQMLRIILSITSDFPVIMHSWSKPAQMQLLMHRPFLCFEKLKRQCLMRCNQENIEKILVSYYAKVQAFLFMFFMTYVILNASSLWCVTDP